MHKNTFNTVIRLFILAASFGSCTATSKSTKSTPTVVQKADIQKPDQVALPETPPEEEATPVVPKEKAAYIAKYGMPQISFVETDGGLCVTIKTKNLELTSVTMEELDNYHMHLFGNAKAMKKYAEGKPRGKKRVKKTLNVWVERWKNKNPFSGLVIRHKAQKSFLGHIVLGLSPEESNAASLAGLINPTMWGNDYGYEAAGALVLFYAPELVRRGYKLPQQTNFERITATARPDNSVSTKILTALGLTVYKQGQPYSDRITRNYYEVAVDALQQ